MGSIDIRIDIKGQINREKEKNNKEIKDPTYTHESRKKVIIHILHEIVIWYAHTCIYMRKIPNIFVFPFILVKVRKSVYIWLQHINLELNKQLIHDHYLV